MSALLLFRLFQYVLITNGIWILLHNVASTFDKMSLMWLLKLMVFLKSRTSTYVVLGQCKVRIGTVNCPYSSSWNCRKYNNASRIWTVNCKVSELKIHAIYLTMLTCKTICYSFCFKNVLITHAISIFLLLAERSDWIGLKYGQVAVSALLVGPGSE